MDAARVTDGTQARPADRAAEAGAVMVLRALARSAQRADERDVLSKLIAASPSGNIGSGVEGATSTGESIPARHRLMAGAAGRAFVPVLVAFEADQSRAAAHLAGDAPPHVAKVVRLRAEVLRGLAATSRERHSGNFRAAVFGANDGLVSNLALVVGMSATGVSATVVLAAGLAGLLAGALSMAAGEYISVRSARELLHASRLDAGCVQKLVDQGAQRGHIALVYQARGMSQEQAVTQAEKLTLSDDQGVVEAGSSLQGSEKSEAAEVVGKASGAAISSFFFFASGALIPILPYLIGLGSTAAVLAAIVLVGIALLATGATVGLLSGASAMRRALRQLAIGYGAAAVTYALGLVFGATGVG